eukprot:4762549-Prymnesium_polylepis.1
MPMSSFAMGTCSKWQHLRNVPATANMNVNPAMACHGEFMARDECPIILPCHGPCCSAQRLGSITGFNPSVLALNAEDRQRFTSATGATRPVAFLVAFRGIHANVHPCVGLPTSVPNGALRNLAALVWVLDRDMNFMTEVELRGFFPFGQKPWPSRHYPGDLQFFYDRR